jgi:hypothetical protein
LLAEDKDIIGDAEEAEEGVEQEEHKEVVIAQLVGVGVGGVLEGARLPGQPRPPRLPGPTS